MSDILTDLFIRNLKPAEKKYTRREKGGFGIRVHPSGRKTFFYLYRVDGQRRFLNLGDYPATKLKDAPHDYEEARTKVRLLKHGRDEGSDPVEHRKSKKDDREERRKAPTMSELVTEYIDRHAKRFKLSWQEDERILNREVVPAWRNFWRLGLKKPSTQNELLTVDGDEEYSIFMAPVGKVSIR